MAIAALILVAGIQTVDAKTITKQMALGSAQATWEQEPTSIIGIELGKQLPDTIERCPFGPSASGQPCLHGTGNLLSLWGQPNLVVQYGDRIILRDDKVQSVTLLTKANDYETLKELLINKYGKPTATSTSTVKNLSGGEFPSETNVWIGRAVSIRLEQRYEKIDQSAAVVEDNALTKAAIDEFKAKQADSVSKL